MWNGASKKNGLFALKNLMKNDKYLESNWINFCFDIRHFVVFEFTETF